MKRCAKYGLWFFLVIGLMVLSGGSAVQAQDSTPAPTPQPDMVQTLDSLQATVDDQQATIEALQNDLDVSTREVAVTAREDYQAWLEDTVWLLVGSGVVLAFLGFFGYTNYRSAKADLDDLLKTKRQEHEQKIKQMDQKFADEAHKIFNKVIYGADPHRILIHYPSTQAFSDEINHLRDMGFSNLKAYDPDKFGEYEKRFSDGIVIFHVRADWEEKDNKDLDPLIEYAKQNNPDKHRVAYLIYSPGLHKKVPELVRVFPNVVTANFPATIITQIYALARMLNPTPKAD